MYKLLIVALNFQLHLHLKDIFKYNNKVNY